MEHVLRAVADPTRREMLARLTAGGLPASALGAGFPISQPAVSQHLKVLRDAGLVADRRHGRQRVYHLRPEGLKAIHTWVSTFEQFWDARLDTLERVLADLEEPTDG